MTTHDSVADRAPRRGRVHLALLALVLVVGASVRLAALGKQSMWYDEVNGVRIAARSLPMVFEELKADASPPLYYLLMHGWVKVFGTDPAAVRLLPALFGIALLPVLYWAGRLLYDRWTALWATGWAALSEFHLFYSQEARMYTMLALFALLSAATMARALRGGTPRRWVAVAACSILTLYTHNYGVFVVGSLFLYGAATVYLRKPARGGLQQLAATAGAVALLYLPWLLFALRYQVFGTAVTSHWLPPFSLWRLKDTAVYFSSLHMYDLSAPVLWIGAPAIAVASVMVVATIRRRDTEYVLHWGVAPASRLLLAWMAGTLLVPLLISTVKPVYLPHRYSIAAWPAFALLLAHGFSRLRDRLVQALVGGAIAVSAVSGTVWHFQYLQKAPDRDVAEWIEQRHSGQDVVVFAPHWAGVSLTYYLGDLPNQIGFPMKALAERRDRCEARERGEREMEDTVEMVRERLTQAGGRLFFVRTPWGPRSIGLEHGFETFLWPVDGIGLGHITVTLYDWPPQHPAEEQQ